MAKEFTPSASNRAAYDKMTDTPVAGVVPPQAVELEETVLGALMLEKDSIIAVQEYITADAFYTEEHRLIYKAIESLSAELKPIDLYTVTEHLKARKELKKVGGAAYLAQLTQKVGSAANIEFHAKIIAQKYVQRELIRSTEQDHLDTMRNAGVSITEDVDKQAWKDTTTYIYDKFADEIDADLVAMINQDIANMK